MTQTNSKTTDASVQVGHVAPDFTLTDQNGAQIKLSDYIGKSAIVLYFYPKDDSAGCTAEACGFRDNYEDFKDAGAEVIGVSSDTAASHQRFASKNRLPFVLVADEHGAVRKRYGVPTTFGLLPGRVTYVIDTQGVVRHIFSAQFTPAKHIGEALKSLKSLSV